jgi:hypothetical protein
LNGDRRPIVYFQPSGDCELGDLLVLVRRRGHHGGQSRALLLQAKTPSTAIPVDQRLLYKQWPAFSYARGRAPERRIPGSKRFPGAKFAHLWTQACNAHPGQPMFDYSVLTGDLVYDQPLRDEVVDLLELMAGEPFCERRYLRPQHIGWSRVFWDLIDRTRRSAVADARGGRHRNIELFRASSSTPTLLSEGLRCSSSNSPAGMPSNSTPSAPGMSETLCNWCGLSAAG